MSNTGITIDGNKALDQISNDGFNIGLFLLFLFILILIGLFIYIKFIKTTDGNKVGDIKENTGPVLVGNNSKITNLSDKK